VNMRPFYEEGEAIEWLNPEVESSQ